MQIRTKSHWLVQYQQHQGAYYLVVPRQSIPLCLLLSSDGRVCLSTRALSYCLVGLHLQEHEALSLDSSRSASCARQDSNSDTQVPLTVDAITELDGAFDLYILSFLLELAHHRTPHLSHVASTLKNTFLCIC